MPSIALLFHLVDVVADQNVQKGVSENSAVLAAMWCEYLERHAKKVYAAEFDAGNQSVHLLAEKIESGANREGDTVREVNEKDWSGLRDSDTVRAGLSVLEAHNWVRVITRQTGGRPSEIITINPEIARDKNNTL